MLSVCTFFLLFSSVFISVQSSGIVAFRLDDIQDYWLDEAQQAVINVFRNAHLPISIGIIANEFGEDDEMLSYVKDCITDTSFPVEIANHGWNHEYFSESSESKQATLLSEAKAKTLSQLSPLISDITTFIPPYNDFNTNTFTAMRSAGFDVITSDVSFFGYNDDGTPDGSNQTPYPGNVANVIQYPAGAGTTDLFDDHVISVADSMEMINLQMSIAGFSVVMLHFDWYCSESGNTVIINQTMITMLQQLIQECQNAGYTFTTVGGLKSALGGSSSSSAPATTGKSAPATTGKVAPATTGKVAPATTGKVAPATTGKVAPATTGKVAPATTGKVAPATTGKSAPATTGKAAPATTGKAASGSCTNGNMQCASSNTYQVCDHGTWAAAQSCQTGLSCHASGSYIYCY